LSGIPDAVIKLYIPEKTDVKELIIVLEYKNSELPKISSKKLQNEVQLRATIMLVRTTLPTQANILGVLYYINAKTVKSIDEAIFEIICSPLDEQELLTKRNEIACFFSNAAYHLKSAR